MFRRIAILSIAIACLAGCSMAPRYNRPEAPVSATWPTGPAYKDVTEGICRQDGDRHTLAGVFC